MSLFELWSYENAFHLRSTGWPLGLDNNGSGFSQWSHWKVFQSIFPKVGPSRTQMLPLRSRGHHNSPVQCQVSIFDARTMQFWSANTCHRAWWFGVARWKTSTGALKCQSFSTSASRCLNWNLICSSFLNRSCLIILSPFDHLFLSFRTH